MNRLLIQLFRVLISILFVFSAITKLLSLPFFDGLIAELFLGSEYYNNPDGLFWTQLFTRVVIAGELLLAVAVLHEYLLKQVVLPVLQLMLVGFTVHLTYVGFQKGFIGENCGCFGDIIPMDNAQSIAKNVVTILMVGYIQWKYKAQQNLTFKSWVPTTIIGLVTFSTLYLTIKEYKTVEQPIIPSEVVKNNDPSIITNIDTNSSVTLIVDSTQIDSSVIVVETIKKDSSEKSTNVEGSHTINIKKSPNTEVESKEKVVKATTTVSQSQLLAKYTQFSTENNVNLNEGEKLICMFSLTCGHCQKSYKELVELSKTNIVPPMYLLCYGKKFDLGFFFSQAGGEDPYYLLSDYNEFGRLLAGSNFPKILLNKDGITQKFWDSKNYKIEAIRQLFNEAKKTKKSNELELGTGSEFGGNSGGMYGTQNEEIDF